MIKVAMIGAGSVVFSKNLTGDILSFPEFKDATFAYMDIDEERLQVGADLCRKVGKTLDANPTIEAYTDRREALKDADFVINMVQIGGFNSTLVDFEIPRKYGLNFTIADTTGPGGFFRALRTYPMLKGLCEDMMDVCPKAVLLNYSNPMSMNMQTIYRTSNIKAVGLCHSVQGTLDEITRYIGEKSEDVAFICAGINHMSFYTKLEKDGVDLYPRLFEAMNDPKTFAKNKVRFELMRRFGYFVTESSEHNAEYSSYFIPHGKEYYDKFDVPIDEYLRRCDGIVDEFERMKEFSKSDEPMNVHRSHEYGSTIIHSMVTGTPSVVYGNMPNNGAISNLPDTAIAEVPTLVDRSGLQFTHVGELPPQLIGYMQPHVTQHELFIRAAMEGRRDHIYQAAMFDPLTAATMPTDKIVEMCDELIEGHRDFLPPLDAKKTLVPTSGKSFSPPTPQELRASWDAAQEQAVEDMVQSWEVIGPFRNAPVPVGAGAEIVAEDLASKGLISTPDDPDASTQNGSHNGHASNGASANGASSNGQSGNISLSFMTPVEEDFTSRGDGSVELTASYPGDQADGGGSGVLRWKSVSAPKGFVDLNKTCGYAEQAVAYAYCEIESVHPRETVLKCGSDDGIKVWINGQVVHQWEGQRGHSPGSDQKAIHLQAGVNRVLVKVSQYSGGWGFSVGIPKANF
ncbi:MAG TPA: alpha-glucosidase/alpha-galactosidase [Abditibacteriaceae bacterium]|jgi:alpha-galactosidase